MSNAETPRGSSARARQPARKPRSTPSRGNVDDFELAPEYDLFSKVVVAKGRFAPDRQRETNLAVLAPDVASAFRTDEALNQALRALIELAAAIRPPAAS